jgi:hypothetical protein
MTSVQQTRGKWDDDDFEVSPEHLIPAKMLYEAPKAAHSDSLLYFPIPKGTKDATTGAEIKEGDIVIDFIRARSCWQAYESELDRYHLESSFKALREEEGSVAGVSRFRAKYF